MAEPIGTIVVSVPEAARLLGISERAVRKRITAGTLHAEREGGGPWRVRLGTATAAPGGTEGGTSSAGAEPLEAAFSPIGESPGVALVPLAAVADQLQGLADRLADMALEVGQLRERTTVQEETIAELRRRAEAAEAERDELRRQAAPAPPHEATSPPAQVEASTPPVAAGVPRNWWRRIFGREG